MNRNSISDARDHLPQLIKRAEQGDITELTRHGQPVAVLMGREQYEKLTSGRDGFAKAFKEFEQRVNLAELDLDPDALFADVRDASIGRDISVE